ncbi:TRAP transporter small permease [Mangrovicoccus algicola]|uniref:TRAP transporter small permease protein n=1 Tax=Mangrovicoccus algicola TaxID=2771008 RepID=A0A8J6YW12_9RHOB|nr:TRAP transporter small permease [Mangrovicoccus algicola]MBE3637249.1 TRAP transporter small permease [Mangrovicoccus algicola]
MNEHHGKALYDRIGQGLARLSHWLGLIGGVFMIAAMMTLVVHVIGNVFGAPILGADEIVELLIGASIFCFLAPTHLKGANIVVDYFSKPLPPAMRNLADVIMTLVFALVAALLTWRLYVGGLSAWDRNKQSMFLSLPEWPTYLVGAIACTVWVVVILYTTWTSLRVFLGIQPPAASEEREHIDG